MRLSKNSQRRNGTLLHNQHTGKARKTVGMVML